MSRLLVICSLVACASTPAAAQNATVGGVTGIVDVGAVIQSYTVGDNPAVGQTSVPLSASVRLPSGLGVGLRTVYANASSDDLEALSGLGDSQIGLSFLKPTGGGIVEASVGLNLPTGQGTLSEEAFATASTIAFDDYAFATPTLGQGAALTPALTAAIPAGPNAALGFGVSYSMKSAYEPFEDDSSSYAPASELAVTAGLDSRAGANSISLDVTWVRYGLDEFRGTEYQPGNKLAATARWLIGRGGVRGHLLMRYRQVLDGVVGADDRPVAYLRPSHANVAMGVQVVANKSSVDLTVGARYYGSLSDLSSSNALGDHQVLLDLSATPAIAISPAARLRGGLTYTLGLAARVEEANAPEFSGFRASGGLELTF